MHVMNCKAMNTTKMKQNKTKQKPNQIKRKRERERNTESPNHVSLGQETI